MLFSQRSCQSVPWLSRVWFSSGAWRGSSTPFGGGLDLTTFLAKTTYYSVMPCRYAMIFSVNLPSSFCPTAIRLRPHLPCGNATACRLMGKSVREIDKEGSRLRGRVQGGTESLYFSTAIPALPLPYC